MIKLSFILFFSLMFTPHKTPDLLTQYAEKPAKLEFVKSEVGKGQIISTSYYNVSGKDSFEIEKILMEQYGMGKLKWICCGWEPEDGRRGSIKHKDLKEFEFLSIEMYGNAEIIGDDGVLTLEKDRNKVTFEVIVRYGEA